MLTLLKAPVVMEPPELRLIVRPVLLTGSLKFTVTLIAVPALYWPLPVVDVALVIVGGVLSTVNVPLGPAAVALFPATSVAVPAAIDIPRVPSPVMELIVTVRVVPVSLTPRAPLAVPVLFRVISPVTSVLALKFVSEYVTVKLTGPPVVSVGLGAPIPMVIGLLLKVRECPAGGPRPLGECVGPVRVVGQDDARA